MVPQTDGLDLRLTPEQTDRVVEDVRSFCRDTIQLAPERVELYARFARESLEAVEISFEKYGW